MMQLPKSLSIRSGHLYCGDVDTIDLIKKYNTPLYVTNEDHILNNYRRFESALKKYTDNIQILYATKANENPVIIQTLANLGAGADIFSFGELQSAIGAGIPADKLLFNGSSKTELDLITAIKYGIKISVDSLDELQLIDKITKSLKKTAKIGFRINPEISVPTHPKIATGIKNSKFGIPADMILDAYKQAISCEYIVPVGIHCHIGSQILDVEPFSIACKVIMDIAKKLTVQLGIKLEFIDFGGGLGIPYNRTSNERSNAPTPEEYADAVMPIFLDACKELNISPSFWIEPGRWLVGESTVLLTNVNSVKSVHKTFINVDAGFNILIRPAMYDSWHEILVANKADLPPEITATVTGPICETGDIIASDRKLPQVVSGDTIAILDAGAYGYAMASQYNCRPRCAEVLVKGDKAELMRRAETYNDLVSTVVYPSWHRG